MFGEGNDEVRGMIPRAVEQIFNKLKEKERTHDVAVVCSFLEIYNDQIRDLGKAYLVAMGVEESSNMAIFEKTSDIFESIAGKRGNPYFAPAFHKAGSSSAQNQEDVLARPGLKEVQDEYQTMNYDIREDADGNVFVKDLSLVPVTKLDEVIALINAGVRVRATHETKMNATSSRSHTVFTVTVVQKDKLTGTATSGMLNLVDLAGSERIKKSESQGIRLKEALHINSSLSALGKVVTALDPSSENTHVPYRDSKLTRVLQNSLGGNSYTVVLAAIHPHSSYYEECLSTLQFANRCRNVRNNPRINYVEDNEDKDRKIRRLQEELQQLRQKISQLEGSGGGGGRHVQQAIMKEKGPEIMKNLVVMLKKAGIEANFATDGGLMLNGQKISADDLGLAEGSVDSFTGSQIEDSGSVSGGGGGKGPSIGGGGGAAYLAAGKAGSGPGNQKMKKIISELQDANSQLQAKLKDRKVLMDEQGRQIQEMTNELTRLQTSIRHKEYEYKQLADEKERALSHLESNMKDAHSKELDELVSNNRSLQQTHQTTLQNAPESFKVYGALIKKAQESKASFEGPLRQEFEKHLLSLEKTRVTELSNIKTQYEYWLQQKDKALEEFVAKFNSFREKKAEQLRMCENEIVRLFAYTEKIENILDGVEKGKYRVQQRQGQHGKTTTGVAHVLGRTSTPGAGTSSSLVGGGDPEEVEMGAVVLPKGVRPINPLTDDAANLELTKRIVGSHKQRQIKLEKMKEEAFHRSLQAAARSETIGTVDPVLQQQIRDLLVASGDARGASSSALPIYDQQSNNGGAENNTGDLANSTPMRPVRLDAISQSSSNQFGGEGEVGQMGGKEFGRSGSSLAVDNSAYMREIEELKAQNEELRKQNLLSLSKISDQLSSHDMIVYLRSLEGEIDKQRKLLKEQSAQIQNLKVANTSLTRIIEKQTSTVRPRTAMGRKFL